MSFAPVAPAAADRLQERVDGVIAHLRAHAAWLGVDPKMIRDSAVDAVDAKRLPSINVFAGEEPEEFGPNGHPQARAVEGEVICAVEVGESDGWRSRTMQLTARMRAVLLGHAAFVAAHGPIVGCRRSLSFQDGALVIGGAVLAIRFRYATAYPPAIPDSDADASTPPGATDHVAAVGVAVDPIDPADPNNTDDGTPTGGPDGQRLHGFTVEFPEE